MKQIETIHLFPELSTEFISLLKGLEHEEWEKPSPIEGRTVKDLASHILDGSLRRLSLQRDKFSDNSRETNINSYSDLVSYIQDLNKEWILASRRLSPKILIDLLEYSEKQVFDFFKSLNMTDKALFSVAWAGESKSENWFDIAREYTEKWHHQMQIRLALNKPLLMDKKYIEPLYDTFMLGLPFHYKDLTDYTTGLTIKITLTGILNKSWYLQKQTEQWSFIENHSIKTDVSIELPDSIAWILFTNTDRNKEKYKSKVNIEGDNKLGLKLMDFVAVMS
jgi:hypothetical protein